MANRFFNARVWSRLGWPQPAIEYLRLNDADTTQIIADLAVHEAAADPHPGYLTPAEGDAAYAPRSLVSMSYFLSR